MAIKTFTYDVSGGNTTVDINNTDAPTNSTTLSMQVQGDGNVDDAVIVKFQESNVHATGRTDITGATITANTSTDEFVANKDISGGFLAYDIAVGSATAGIITIILKTK